MVLKIFMKIKRNPTKYFIMFMNFTSFYVVICYKLCKTQMISFYGPCFVFFN